MQTKKKKEREREDTIDIRNESGNITMDSIDIKRIIKKYYEQLYAHKFDNLDEMVPFCERHNLPKPTQG